MTERLQFFEAEVPLLAGLPPPLLRRIASAAVRICKPSAQIRAP